MIFNLNNESIRKKVEPNKNNWDARLYLLRLDSESNNAIKLNELFVTLSRC